MSNEVLEFIIVPPYAQRAAIMASKERFELYLGNRFPGYTFKLAPFAPVGDDQGFCVLPVMNFIGDDGKGYICEPPKRWILQEVTQACRRFDHTRPSGIAA